MPTAVSSWRSGQLARAVDVFDVDRAGFLYYNSRPAGHPGWVSFWLDIPNFLWGGESFGSEYPLLTSQFAQIGGRLARALAVWDVRITGSQGRGRLGPTWMSESPGPAFSISSKRAVRNANSFCLLRGCRRDDVDVQRLPQHAESGGAIPVTRTGAGDGARKTRRTENVAATRAPNSPQLPTAGVTPPPSYASAAGASVRAGQGYANRAGGNSYQNPSYAGQPAGYTNPAGPAGVPGACRPVVISRPRARRIRRRAAQSRRKPVPMAMPRRGPLAQNQAPSGGGYQPTGSPSYQGVGVDPYGQPTASAGCPSGWWLSQRRTDAGRTARRSERRRRQLSDGRQSLERLRHASRQPEQATADRYGAWSKRRRHCLLSHARAMAAGQHRISTRQHWLLAAGNAAISGARPAQHRLDAAAAAVYRPGGTSDFTPSVLRGGAQSDLAASGQRPQRLRSDHALRRGDAAGRERGPAGYAPPAGYQPPATPGGY